MSQMLLINPRRRRKAKKSRSSGRKRHRKMTAKQLKFFGPRRKRSHARRRSRRRSLRTNPYLPVLDNPRRRRRSRRASSARRSRRSYRRNPISSSGLAGRVTLYNGTVNLAVNSLVGAAGAVGVDILMGQAGRFLPPSVTSEYSGSGGLNWAQVGTKAALAVVVGLAGAKYLPGRLRGLAAKAAEGSLTVQAYKILRPALEKQLPGLTLGYYNPAMISRSQQMSAYLPRPRLRGTTYPGVTGSKQNFEGYSL